MKELQKAFLSSKRRVDLCQNGFKRSGGLKQEKSLFDHGAFIDYFD